MASHGVRITLHEQRRARGSRKSNLKPKPEGPLPVLNINSYYVLAAMGIYARGTYFQSPPHGFVYTRGSSKMSTSTNLALMAAAKRQQGSTDARGDMYKGPFLTRHLAEGLLYISSELCLHLGSSLQIPHTLI